MRRYFATFPDAVDNTVEIAKRCQVEFDFKTYHFPQFEIDSATDVDTFFGKGGSERF